MNFRFFVPLLFLSQLGHTQVAFFEGSYEGLKKKAKDYKKNYFIDFHTDWCGFCKKMDATTFQNQEIGKVVNEGFMAIKLNAEKEGNALAQKLNVNGYPTVVFFNYKGELLGVHPGYKSAGEFKLLLDRYQSESKRVSLSTFFKVNQNYIDQLKIKSLNTKPNALKDHIRSASTFGTEDKRFQWEEYILDNGLDEIEELHSSIYFYLKSSNFDKAEKQILTLIDRNELAHEELAYLLSDFVYRGKAGLNQIKWGNELVLMDTDPFYKELRIAVQYAYGDVKDASVNFNNLRKWYKKNKIDREKSMTVFQSLFE